MGIGSCAKALNQEPSDCANGCLDDVCCKIAKCGANPHHCLAQLDKRLNNNPKKDGTCGMCRRAFRSDSV